MKAYYGSGEIKKDYDQTGRLELRVTAEWTLRHVKRIYEVPNSWGDEGGIEALKAQAVAARSYALAWTREEPVGIFVRTKVAKYIKMQ